MATKKAAAKKTGTAMAPWGARLAEKTDQAAATASSTGGGAKTINTRGGVFSIGGVELNSKELDVIIADFVVDVTYYPESFDADEVVPPMASALGRDEKTLVWADNSHPDYAGKELKDSDIFEWGSADKGKGKAAKSKRRLMVVAEGWLKDPKHEDNQPHKLMVPVTSGKEFDKYVKDLKRDRNRPPCGVLTRISIHAHPKYQHVLKFKMLGTVDDDSMQDVLDLSDSVEEDLFRPYADFDQKPEEKKPAGKGAGKAQAKTAGKRR